MKELLRSLITLLACGTLLSSCYTLSSSDGGGRNARDRRVLDPADVALPPGYQAEVAASGLTFPTAVTFDEDGTLYVVEAGYSYGEVFLPPRLLRIRPGKEPEVVLEADKNGPWTHVEYHDGYFYIAEGGQLEGGRILRVSRKGEMQTLVENLPGLGDHHTNGVIIGPDGYLYFGQGTATNSGVVGRDNYQFGWMQRFPDFHDVPCRDITLTGQNFQTDDFLSEGDTGQETTGAFVPFGTSTTEGQTIEGELPCSGSVMRVPLQGGPIELVAWGFRNPYGLAFDEDGQLYVADNGYDDRGSRPVWGVGDYLWKVNKGKWYGWPDFTGGLPLTIETFTPNGEQELRFLLSEHPNEPPEPVASFGVHSSSDGIDFSRNAAFGYKGEAFVAQFGDMSPGVGKVMAPVGYRVVRVNVDNGVITEFAANYGKENGPASWLGSGGLERPVSVQFSPQGDALYITDFGIVLTDEDTGPQPQEKTGVIWRITKKQTTP